MALLERGLKQRIVGALVLIALAVIFLPMLFTREDESRQVVVEAPPRPQAPAMPSVEVQPTEVPELQPGEEDIAPEIVEEGSSAAAGQQHMFGILLQGRLQRHAPLFHRHGE
ncbi:hypothetical protein LZM11_32500, partial [Pseudomonas aeruginosa]|nr:hypothetical protein [Pseudomonas aeruginosa]